MQQIDELITDRQADPVDVAKLESAGVTSDLLALVGRDEQDDLRQMLVLSRQRREILLRLVYQQRYKNIMEAWLYIHVPMTFALLAALTAHIVSVFFFF